jgi:hypothetical protein
MYRSYEGESATEAGILGLSKTSGRRHMSRFTGSAQTAIDYNSRLLAGERKDRIIKRDSSALFGRRCPEGVDLDSFFGPVRIVCDLLLLRRERLTPSSACSAVLTLECPKTRMALSCGATVGAQRGLGPET